MAKLERRSLKDKARARRLKDPNAGKHNAPKTEDQKSANNFYWQQRKDQGVAGLAGAGRGGKHPSRKEKEKRREEKHKGKSRGHEAAAFSLDTYKIAYKVCRQWLTKEE